MPGRLFNSRPARRAARNLWRRLAAKLHSSRSSKVQSRPVVPPGFLVATAPSRPPVPSTPPRERPTGFEITPDAQDQSQSLFFKLPREIREEIYRYVLIGAPIHIQRRDYSRLTYLRCLRPTTESPVADEEALQKWYGHCMDRGLEISFPWGKTKNYMIPSGIMALLTACQRTYSESVNILYSANTFTAESPKDFISFTSTIPQRHVEAIQSLRLGWHFDDWSRYWDIEKGLKKWEEIVSLLPVDMPSLSKLTVFLGHFAHNPGFYCCVSLPEPSIPPPADYEAQLLQSLRQVQGPKDFVVCANWHVRRDLVRDAPFQLVEIAWEDEARLRTDVRYWHTYYECVPDNPPPMEGWILFGDERVPASVINIRRSMRSVPI